MSHGNLGRSTLPQPTQDAVETDLRDGRTLNAIARRHNISRDQARTIRQRLLRGDQRTEGGELANLKYRLYLVEEQLRQLQNGTR